MDWIFIEIEGNLKRWNYVYRRKNKINGNFLKIWITKARLRNCKSWPKKSLVKRQWIENTCIWFIWGLAKRASIKIGDSWICEIPQESYRCKNGCS
jgi:hypothetical protein